MFEKMKFKMKFANGRFRNCDGRNLYNVMPVILRIIMIRCSPLHYTQAMWSGLRPTAKKIQEI